MFYLNGGHYFKNSYSLADYGIFYSFVETVFIRVCTKSHHGVLSRTS
jgi:hypothetical protein